MKNAQLNRLRGGELGDWPDGTKCQVEAGRLLVVCFKRLLGDGGVGCDKSAGCNYSSSRT